MLLWHKRALPFTSTAFRHVNFNEFKQRFFDPFFNYALKTSLHKDLCVMYSCVYKKRGVCVVDMKEPRKLASKTFFVKNSFWNGMFAREFFGGAKISLHWQLFSLKWRKVSQRTATKLITLKNQTKSLGWGMSKALFTLSNGFLFFSFNSFTRNFNTKPQRTTTSL